MKFKLGVVPCRASLFLGHFVVGCLIFDLPTSSSCFTLLFHLCVMACYVTLLSFLITSPCCLALLCHFVASPCFIVLLLHLATSPCCCTLLSCLITLPCCIALLIQLTSSPCHFSLNTFLVLINHKLPTPWFGNGNCTKVILSWVCMFKTWMSHV